MPLSAVRLPIVDNSRDKVVSPVVKQLLPLLPCRICGKPVPLDIAKTDEHGKAVHEDCYVLKMRLKRASASPQPYM